MKRIYIILLALAAGGACFALMVLLALGAKGKDSVMTSTDTAPVQPFSRCARDITDAVVQQVIVRHWTGDDMDLCLCLL